MSRRHPAPKRDELSPFTASLLLYTGPLAWLTQLCVGAAMTSWPCFPGTIRRSMPLPGYDWARGGAMAVLVLCAVAATVAGFVAWCRFRHVRDEASGGHDAMAEIGHGRTRFIALWGAYLGVGFALATLVTLAGFLMVPQCLG